MLKERDGGSPSPMEMSTCGGCGRRIHDRFYLLAVDRQWHAHCLKCCECHLPLDAELTCFARDGNIYCKEDYYRMFAVTRCGRCHAGIAANELVMRARDLVYHLHCFSCTSCGIPLSKGDHFGMRDGLVYCRLHYELLNLGDATVASVDSMDLAYGGGGGGDSPAYYPTIPPQHQHHHHQKGRPRKQRKTDESPPMAGDLPVAMRMAQATLEMLQQQGELSSSASIDSLSYDSSVTSPASSTGHQSQRTKRMRTSFKHHQLRTMKTYFAINQNPDAKDLKQLAQKTGLSKRVLQVWFQNARAKWRRNIMRQEGAQGSSNNNNNNAQAATGGSGGVLDVGPVPRQTSLEDIHHRIHSQSSQTLTFGDMY